ncbi:MAG: xanthine dehydrogenase family protein subunit M [Gemmatimonadota bacterium]|nr:MAG: xanthine dehydrogenase family protein subunit M [Gemmatimonadota bacterium]
MLPNFTYERPGSVDEALEHGSSEGAVLHAGGTDLLGCLRDGVFSAKKVVSLSGLEELRGISPTRDGGLRVGALTTLTGVASDPTIAERYTVLAQAAASAASPQLRNQGTIGGNICQRPRCWYFRGDWHCLRKGGDTCYAIAGENHFHCIFGGSGCYIVHPSDTAPALQALGASVRIASRSGSRTVPIESFFLLPADDIQRENLLEPGELVTEVLLPPVASGTRSVYRKVRDRGAWDFALAGLAAVVTMPGDSVETASLVLSGVAPKPWRAAEAEGALTGARLDAETIARVVAASVAGALPLEHNGYKVALVRGLMEETLRALA